MADPYTQALERVAAAAKRVVGASTQSGLSAALDGLSAAVAELDAVEATKREPIVAEIVKVGPQRVEVDAKTFAKLERKLARIRGEKKRKKETTTSAASRACGDFRPRAQEVKP